MTNSFILLITIIFKRPPLIDMWGYCINIKYNHKIQRAEKKKFVFFFSYTLAPSSGRMRNGTVIHSEAH